MNNAIRTMVRERARDRCEYCRIRQVDIPYVKLQIEHVIPRQHGGADSVENLALACHRCNKHKGPNLTAFDPRTGRLVRLFNPRKQKWLDHFSLRRFMIRGHTATGRATVELLRMNATKRQALRRQVRR